MFCARLPEASVGWTRGHGWQCLGGMNHFDAIEDMLAPDRLGLAG